MAGPTATFHADFTAWNAALKDATVKLKSFEVAAGNVGQQLKRAFSTFSGEKVIRDANLAVEAVKKLGGAAHLTASEQSRLNATLTEALAKYKALGQQAPDSLRAVKKELDALARIDLAKVGANLTQLGQGAAQAGAALTKAITVPLVAMGTLAAKSAIDFESSFAGVRKTVDATDQEFAVMAQSMRNLAKEIPINVNELNRLGEAAGAMGIPKAAIVDFTKTMALLGVTTNLTADQAAESIGKIQNIFGAAGKETDRFAATLVALGNAGASTEADILEMAKRIAGAGNTIGLTQGQVLGFANALSSVGIEAEAGGTAISRVFIDMAAAVSKGGKELAQFAQVANMSSEQFARTFKDDAAGAALAFVEGLQRIKREGGDVLATLAAMDIKEIRLRDTLLRLAGAGDVLRGSLELQEKAWRENSALTVEAQKRFETFSAQLTLLGNRINDVGISIGQAMLPALQATVKALDGLLPALEEAVKGFGELPGPVQLTVGAFLGIAAAAGPALFIFGQLAISAGALVTAFAEGGVAAKLFAGEIVALNSVLGVLGLLGAVVAAMAAFAGLGRATREATQEVEQGNVTWGGVAAALTNAIARGINPFTAAWQDTAQAIREAKQAWDIWQGRTIEPPKAPAGPPRLPGAPGAQMGAALAVPDVPKELPALYNELARGLELAGTAAGSASGGLAALRAEVERLDPERMSAFAEAVKSGAYTVKQLTAEFGVSASAIRLYKSELNDAGKAQKALEKQTASVQKSLTKLANYTATLAAKQQKSFFAEMARQAEIADKAILANLKITQQANAEYDRTVREQGLSRTGFLISEVQRWEREEKATIDKSVGNWQAAFTATERLATQKINTILTESTELAMVFAQLGTLTGGMFGPVFIQNAENAAKTIKALGLEAEKTGDSFGKKLGANLSKNLGEALAGIPQTIVQGLLHDASWEDMAIAIASMIGAAIGAAIGGALAGPAGAQIGAALGALLGPLLDAVWQTRAEETQERIRVEFGVAISEGLAQAIEDAADRFLGNREAAKLFNLDRIIAEGGGLTTDNLDEMFARFRDVFSLLETGAIDAADAISILDRNFKTFADFVTAGGALASKELLEIIRLSGTASAAVNEFVDAQARSALEGLQTFIDTRGDIATSLAEAQDNLNDLLKKKAPSEEIAKAREEVAKFQAQLAAIPLTAAGAEAFGASLFAIFEQLARDGVPALEIIRQMDPVIASLDEQLKKAGLSGGAAFDSIKTLAALARDEIAGPAFTAIAGLGQALEGLHNSGLLTQETFSGIAEQITATYAGLVAQGKGGADALRLMGGPLQDLWELQQDFGYAVDEATQKLLDEAEAAGVVGDQHRSVQEKMLMAVERTAEAVEALANLFGAELPSAIKKTRDEVEKIPKDVEIDVRYDVERLPNPDRGPGGIGAGGGTYRDASGNVYTGGERPEYFAHGGPVYAQHGMWAPRGTDTVPAMLTPGEVVLPREVVAALRSSSGGGAVTVNLSISAIDGADVERVVRSPEFRRALTSAVSGNVGGYRTDLRTAIGVR